MRSRKVLFAALLSGGFLYGLHGFAMAQDVPMPCDPDSTCGPVPTEPPGCPDCAPGPAPDPGTAPGGPIEPDDQNATPPDDQNSTPPDDQSGGDYDQM